MSALSFYTISHNVTHEGRTKVSMGDLFGIAAEAEARLSEKENSVVP